MQGRGFIEAGNLLVDDKLVSANSEDLVIEKFYIEETENSVDVYNFQVEDFHTYFVGENGVWVHNASDLYARVHLDAVQDKKQKVRHQETLTEK